MRKSTLISSLLYLILPLTSAVSLTEFQKLTVQVTSSCTAAYDRTIPSCTVDDFKNSATCSSGCISGLNQIANGVLNSCGGTVVGSSTLLGRIFKGGIISSLCPNNGQSTSTAEKQSTTAAPASAKPSAAAPIAKSSSAQSSAAAPSSSSTSAASSSSSPAAQSSSSTATAASTSATSAGASSASSSTSGAAPAQTSQTQAQPVNGKPGLTVQQSQIAAMGKSGGGSPFDIVGYSAASHLPQRDLLATTLGVTLLIASWLLR